MKPIKYSLILLTTLLLSWLMPMFYHLMTDEASGNVFTYYSSIEKSFCIIDFDEKEESLIRKNVKTGREYSEAEFDSVLPMFYYRQLLSDGRLPDTISGQALTPRMIGQKTFYHRYNAIDKNTPKIPIYTLFESFSGRVRLEMPGDVFRLTDKIEFIDPETNTVNQEKSQRFMKAFERAQFQFPAKQAAGNPSTRKAYDEGYFIIDNADQVFHLKMVNGKPFLKNIKWMNEAKPVYISTIEPDDRSFYAFVYDENNQVWIITTEKYQTQLIPTPEFNMDRDRLMIMANPLYWNVNVSSDKGKQCYAIDASTKQLVDTYEELAKESTAQWGKYILPFEVKMEAGYSRYITPDISCNGWLVLPFNFFLMVLLFVLNRYRSRSTALVSLAWVILTGIFGFIPALILSEKK